MIPPSVEGEGRRIVGHGRPMTDGEWNEILRQREGWRLGDVARPVSSARVDEAWRAAERLMEEVERLRCQGRGL